MKYLVLLLSLSAVVFTATAQYDARQRSFNSGWRFAKDSTIDASGIAYDDSSWRTLDLPHDWSIEDLPAQVEDSVIGPFSRMSIGQGATGFTVGGTGWYRKGFVTEKSFEGKLVTIHFDGVYMLSDVWLNGHLLGTHTYGYTPFRYDLTKYLNPPGKENVLVVKVKNPGRNSRWYSGSGIYRNVSLTITEPLYLDTWGMRIITKELSNAKALIEISTDVYNQTAALQSIILSNTIVSPDGKVVKLAEQSLGVSKNTFLNAIQTLEVSAPAAWSIESPHLYKLVTEIKRGQKLLDRIETPFGIRSITVSAESGFKLNGQRVLLKGGSVHHDNGPLGAAVYYRAEERKVEILKRNGYNAVRTSHNPPSKEFLDACDKVGVLVIDEAFDMWEQPKNPQDYHLYFKQSWQRDLDAMVLRDRNHPCVVIWSIGNEIKERVDSSGLRITKMLAERVRQLDPSRPVTEAHCTFWDNPGYQWESTPPAYALLDVGGYNYLLPYYEKDHASFPSRIILGTESFPNQALENWNMVEKNPYVIGDFVWTAFDYMGEASIGNTRYDTTRKMFMSLGWPWFNAYCGDFDLVGNKKPQSYYRDVVWREKPISIAVHAPVPKGMVENISFWGWPDEMQSWNWPGTEGQSLQVRVFSREPLIRLYLNDKLVGEKSIAGNTITATFDVPYQPGLLKAVGVRGGKETHSVSLKTTGAPAKLLLRADRININSHDDLSYVMVEVLDSDGRIVPNASIPVKFSITGEGIIAGVGNGDPTDVSSFQKPAKKTWRGQGLVIVRGLGKTGTLTLKASANELSSNEVVITLK